MTETDTHRPYMTRAELYRWASAINEPITDEVITSTSWHLQVQDEGRMDEELDTLVASNWCTALRGVLRTAWMEMLVAQRAIDTAKPVRVDIGAALIRSGVCDRDDVDLLQRQACNDCPAQGSKCGCSGVPYVSDAVWNELAPAVIAAQNQAFAIARKQIAEMTIRRTITALFRGDVPARERTL